MKFLTIAAILAWMARTTGVTTAEENARGNLYSAAALLLVVAAGAGFLMMLLGLLQIVFVNKPQVNGTAELLSGLLLLVGAALAREVLLPKLWQSFNLDRTNE